MRWFFKGLAMAVVGIVLAILYCYAFMYLWNWLVPDIFSGPKIVIWEAAGILLLGKMLFGGFGHWGKGCNKCGGKKHWKSSFRKEWRKMSEEERDRCKEKFKSKFRRCFPDDEETKPETNDSNEPQHKPTE